MEKKILNNYGSFDIVFEKGKGSTLWDVNGKKYIDFLSGIGVNCLGHNYKPLVKAISPVPGGVGRITTCVLVSHVIEAAKRHAKKRPLYEKAAR